MKGTSLSLLPFLAASVGFHAGLATVSARGGPDRSAQLVLGSREGTVRLVVVQPEAPEVDPTVADPVAPDPQADSPVAELPVSTSTDEPPAESSPVEVGRPPNQPPWSEPLVVPFSGPLHAPDPLLPVVGDPLPGEHLEAPEVAEPWMPPGPSSPDPPAPLAQLEGEQDPLQPAHAHEEEPLAADPLEEPQPGDSNETRAAVEVESIPDPSNSPRPEYPRKALVRRWEGTTILLVEISAEGRPIHVSVAESSGHAILDEAALAGVRTWRFVPAQRAGTPVASAVRIPVRFHLSGN
jgi:protein TonB